MHRQHPDRSPRQRLPDDNGERVDPIHDQHTHTRHPNDDRLTEADLDEHERERHARHPRMRTAR